MKTTFALRLLVASLCGFMPLCTQPLAAQTTGSQQLVFAGLRTVANQGQFNAVQSDSTGNLYLLLDQKDGIRLLKTDPTATSILAEAQLGAHGDIGLAMALDPAGNVYITGTTTSGTLIATSGAAFPTAADTSTNSFIGKFDANLNPIFVTFCGSGRMAAAGIAATADAVFITGSLFAATLPVTPSAILQAPASGSFQNGFVEKFNSTGTTLLYATYLTGLNGNTAPTAIAADASDNAYIAGSTTSSGYPTLSAVVPRILGPTSGFLTKLTPSGDGITFSTFIPGSGITSLTLDTAQNLLLTGTVALGQFPVATIQTPLVNTPYQVLIRMPSDGSAVLASTLLAPGTQSTATPAPAGSVWITGPLTAPLLPLTPLSEIGNAYALRVTAQNTIDQTLRFGGLPTANPNYASAPVNITSLSIDPTGQPIFAGSVSPTASTSLLTTETYDLPLYNTPTAALPSSLRDAALTAATCTQSLCAGSAAYLARLNPQAAPTLALSTDDSPNITLRNLGSTAATNLQLTATNFTLTTNCPTTLAPAAECTIALSGTDPGTITVEADNAPPQTATLPATTRQPNPIALSAKELDFGILTVFSPATTRTLSITNLTQQPQTFTSTAPAPFSEASTNCTLTGPTTRTLAPAATCHIILALTATADAVLQTNWAIGTQTVLLTATTQTSALNLSATEIDFGSQFGTSASAGPRLPRYLYLSNNSAFPIPHTPVSLAAASPFTLTDRCPTTLEPHTICQIALTYNSPVAPSADSTTLTLDQGATVLITGTTLAQPTVTGETTNPNLTVSPATINFPSAVVVTTTSSTTQTVTVGNTGASAFALAFTLSGDFTATTNCPANLPAAATCSIVLTFAPSQPGTRQGLLAVTAGTGTSPAYIPLSGVGTPILAANNGTLNFGNVIVGQPSVQWYKITQPFTTLTATISGPDYTAILVEDLGYGHGQHPSSAFLPTATGSCTNCWLGVQFKPSAAGEETAALTLTSATGNPEPLALIGTGLPLTGLILTPVTKDFGPIPINSTSPATLFTLTNQTAAAVTLTPPALTGDFALSPAPTGGPACTGILSPSASCFLEILFTPTTTGPGTGSLTLQTSASTQTAPLTGFGSPDPGLSLNPTALNFTNVPGLAATQQTITLANTGTSQLQIATPTNTNPAFTPTTNCSTLAPAATCTITVAFTPANSYLTDTLQIPVTSTATGLTTYTVPLTSTYTTEDSGLQIIPNQANYGPTATGTLGLTRQFTINNLTAKSLTLAVALPRQFVLSGPPCAGLAPNASCDFAATFLPLTNGDITGTLFAQATPTDNSATLNALGYVEGYGIGAATLSITGPLIPNGTAGNGGLLNFNQVASGQSATQTITLTSRTATPLTIRRITSEWPFLVTATTCGTTLALNQTCTATLTYTPLNQQAAGAPTSPPANDTGTLVIESDALTSPDYIDLAGTAAPLYVAAPVNTAPLAAYTASQSSLAFTTTQVGSASPAQTITLANTGTNTLHITNLQTTPDFSLQSGCTTLVPGASCPIYVTFTPQTPGTHISALEITSDASTALDFISLLGSDATPATLTLSTASLNFGSVVLGTPSALSIQITNNGSTAAIFNSISTTGDYAATGTCPTPGNPLAPSASCTVEITFTPTQPGTRPGTVAISTSATTLPLIANLTGTGTQSHMQLTPSALNFDSLSLGASANQTLTVANTGTAPIDNLALSITGDYALTLPCALTTLAPGASCSATITFTPTTLGQRNGALTVTSSNVPATIPLTGTGVPNGTFTLTVDGGSTSSATVPSGIPATYTLTVTPQNVFAGTVVLNCTPINPGQYATCSLLPSSITLSGTTQTATATINTITRVDPSKPTQSASSNTSSTSKKDKTLLCLLPAALLFFWKTKTRRNSHRNLILWTILLTATTLTLTSCGSGGDASLRYTPPGTYQYQVTATSTNGVQLTQTVTLNLTVTP